MTPFCILHTLMVSTKLPTGARLAMCQCSLTEMLIKELFQRAKEAVMQLIALECLVHPQDTGVVPRRKLAPKVLAVTAQDMHD